jgi:hypothetical protein
MGMIGPTPMSASLVVAGRDEVRHLGGATRALGRPPQFEALVEGEVTSARRAPRPPGAPNAVRRLHRH